MIYVLYHADCRDGFGSAYAAWKHLGDEATYLPCQHGKPKPELVLGAATKIYVVDFSFERDVLTTWPDQVGELVVIDHHVPAQESLQGLPFARFDMERSAAILTWRYFHGEGSEPPEFLGHVEDMDLWHFALEGTREICAAIDSYPHEFRVWDRFAAAGACGRLRDEGVVIRRFVERQVEYVCGEAVRLTVGPYTNVPCVNSGLFVSEACARLLEMHPEAELAAAWFQVEPGRRVFSLRSRKGETDVAELAKLFGGGGHPSASGFSVEVGDVSVAAPSS